MRILLPIMLAASLLAPAAFGQDTPREGLETPEVRESLPPESAPQGTRAPEPQRTETESVSLDQALAEVRRAPPDLQGKPVPRPNQWASEPDDPVERSRSADPSDLTRKDNVGGQ